MESSNKNKDLLVKYDQLLALCLFSKSLGIPALQTILINRSDSLWTSAFDNLQFTQTKMRGENPKIICLCQLLLAVPTGNTFYVVQQSKGHRLNLLMGKAEFSSKALQCRKMLFFCADGSFKKTSNLYCIKLISKPKWNLKPKKVQEQLKLWKILLLGLDQS